MSTRELTIRAVINGKDVPRSQVHDWEAKRLPRAARKVGLFVPPGELAHQRLEFAQAKVELGAEKIRRRLSRDIRVADAIASASTAVSLGRRAHSICDLHVSGGQPRAAEFVDWFSATDRPDYVESMVAANPDHFLIDTAPDGSQEVIETTGGSPLATRFFVDYVDVSSLETPRDPEFPLDLSGVARTSTGDAIGGVRHEFRDLPDGFHARLHVEFPLLTSPTMIAAHRWHLACEFSNWIEAAFA